MAAKSSTRLVSELALAGPSHDPAFAHKHPGPRLIGVAWCLGIIASSLLFPLSSPSRLYGKMSRRNIFLNA